jgi:hypothetical protein
MPKTSHLLDIKIVESVTHLHLLPELGSGIEKTCVPKLSARGLTSSSTPSCWCGSYKIQLSLRLSLTRSLPKVSSLLRLQNECHPPNFVASIHALGYHPRLRCSTLSCPKFQLCPQCFSSLLPTMMIVKLPKC